MMNERKPTWTCPVCDMPALYDDLAVDGYFLELLPQCLQWDELEFLEDGSWRPYGDKNKTPKKMAPLSTPVVESIDSPPKAPAPPVEATAGKKRPADEPAAVAIPGLGGSVDEPAKKKGKVLEVVVLDSSDEEDAAAENSDDGSDGDGFIKRHKEGGSAPAKQTQLNGGSPLVVTVADSPAPQTVTQCSPATDVSGKTVSPPDSSRVRNIDNIAATLMKEAQSHLAGSGTPPIQAAVAGSPQRAPDSTTDLVDQLQPANNSGYNNANYYNHGTVSSTTDARQAENMGYYYDKTNQGTGNRY